MCHGEEKMAKDPVVDKSGEGVTLAKAWQGLESSLGIWV